MIKIAITKGRIEKQVCKLLQQQGFDMDPIFNKDRELLIEIPLKCFNSFEPCNRSITGPLTSDKCN